MINNIFQENFPRHYGRKILQVNSTSSSFNTSQASFIALLCIIGILTIAFVIIVILLCYRYYSHRKDKIKNQHKSKQNKQQSLISKSNNLFTNQLKHDQIFSINKLSLDHTKQSIINNYLNSYQTENIDIKQLNSYLFIDLHSTSSETYQDNNSKKFSNNILTKYQNKNLKQLYNPRFLMRERTLPTNIHKLPQLRQIITQQQKHLFENDDTTTTSTNINNQELQSTNISTTTNDYDDSHAYHVNQNQIMQTIKEEKSSIIEQNLPYSPISYYNEQRPCFFEIVSTSRDNDDSDIQISYKSSPIISNRIVYIDDSFIV